MYKYEWDEETGGVLLLPEQEKVSKEARPVYYRELDLLDFGKYFDYPKDDSAPILWAQANRYYYRGKLLGKTIGGALFTRPSLDFTDSEVPAHTQLALVDVETMLRKNAELLQSLVQETVQDIYHTFLSLKNKTDVIYVAFSGGKDSVVVLDLVQKTLPHDAFKVMFGDTDMELPATLELVEQLKEQCRRDGIEFLIAKSHFPSETSWKIFGPPARKLRWCCSVHKSVPVLNTLNALLGNPSKMRSVMMTGVRAGESDARSGYKKLSLGKKIAGQYSYHPILDWSAIEVYLYIFARHLILNDAYRFGLNRVGCLMCPNASSRYEYVKRAV